MLDEFPNIGQIPDFEKKLATIRSRYINVDVIFQNLAQLKNRYPNDLWQEIIGCCDTQLFLGCTDMMTAKFISDRAGVIGVEVESRQRELQSIRLTDYTPEFKATSGQGKRNLYNVDEIMRLPNDQALVFLRGQKGLKLNKFDYSRHPDSKKLQPCNVRDHVPAWRAARTAQAAAAARPATASAAASAPVPVGRMPSPSSQNSVSNPVSTNQPLSDQNTTSQNGNRTNAPHRAQKPKKTGMSGQQSLLDGTLDGMFSEKSSQDV